jgi:hypothetical protein
LSFIASFPAFARTPPDRARISHFVERAIVYIALENSMGVDLERCVLSMGLFGLMHGFGFSYGLQKTFQFARTRLLVSGFARPECHLARRAALRRLSHPFAAN